MTDRNYDLPLTEEQQAIHAKIVNLMVEAQEYARTMRRERDSARQDLADATNELEQARDQARRMTGERYTAEQSLGTANALIAALEKRLAESRTDLRQACAVRDDARAASARDLDRARNAEGIQQELRSDIANRAARPALVHEAETLRAAALEYARVKELEIVALRCKLSDSEKREYNLRETLEFARVEYNKTREVAELAFAEVQGKLRQAEEIGIGLITERNGFRAELERTHIALQTTREEMEIAYTDMTSKRILARLQDEIANLVRNHEADRIVLREHQQAHAKFLTACYDKLGFGATPVGRETEKEILRQITMRGVALADAKTLLDAVVTQRDGNYEGLVQCRRENTDLRDTLAQAREVHRLGIATKDAQIRDLGRRLAEGDRYMPEGPRVTRDAHDLPVKRAGFNAIERAALAHAGAELRDAGNRLATRPAEGWDHAIAWLEERS